MTGEYRLDTIFDSLPVPILILGTDIPQFSIKATNKAYLEAFGLKKTELVNNGFLDLLSHIESPLEDEFLLNLKASLVQVLSTKENHEIKAQKLRSHLEKSNTQEENFWHVKHTPVLDEDGEIKFIAHVLIEAEDHRDQRESDGEVKVQMRINAEKKTLKDEVTKQTTQYESIRQELDSFVYSVSHDLRAPLRRLDGFSQELLNEYTEQLDETGVHYLKRIRQGAQDLGNLIDDLLKLSRISRRTVEREEFNMWETARDLFEELTQGKDSESISLTPNGDLNIEADPGLTKVLLRNLLSNAIKFSKDQDSPTIVVGSTQKDETPIYFIKDNGVGFDPAHSSKLFKAFNRLHTKKEFDGTGLGLAITKRIVNLHGGEIWAESSPGKGATFYFSLAR